MEHGGIRCPRILEVHVPTGFPLGHASGHHDRDSLVVAALQVPLSVLKVGDSISA